MAESGGNWSGIRMTATFGAIMTPVVVTGAAAPFEIAAKSDHVMPVTIDQATIDRGMREANAYTDNKVLGLGAKLDVVDVRLKGIDEKLASWTNVPTDLATLKERVNHLPTKDELGAKLRNYLAFAVGVMSLVSIAVGVVARFVHP